MQALELVERGRFTEALRSLDALPEGQALRAETFPLDLLMHLIAPDAREVGRCAAAGGAWRFLG